MQLDALDYALRLAFFALVPPLLVFADALFPVTGALAQMALSIAFLLAGEAARTFAARSRLGKLAMGALLDLDAFYAKNPPRPFVYYVFFPILFPYWLAVKSARDEVLLYKGFTLASFAILVVSLVAQYFASFLPQLGFAAFAPVAAITFVAEAAIVVLFLMPIATSVVHYHQRGARGRIAILLFVGLATTTFAILRIHLRRDPIVSFATRRRVQLRTAADPKGRGARRKRRCARRGRRCRASPTTSTSTAR